MKRNILYLAPNNGSDMRIHKEIKTLSKEFKVFYLGVGLENDASHTKFFTEKSIIINGTHKSFVSIVRYIFVLIKILFKQNKTNKILIIIYIP